MIASFLVPFFRQQKVTNKITQIPKIAKRGKPKFAPFCLHINILFIFQFDELIFTRTFGQLRYKFVALFVT